jgi:hypothetical protein
MDGLADSELKREEFEFFVGGAIDMGGAETGLCGWTFTPGYGPFGIAMLGGACR